MISPSPVSPALVCRDVHRRFGSIAAVDGVTLEVARGELVALLGPSGCGKTTMLRMVAGLVRADSGMVEIDGTLVDGPGVHVAPERRHVGLVFQDYALFPHLTVERNVAYGLRRVDRRERQRRVREALDLVGLGDLGRRQVTTLSGGQQQRVALARALAPRPDLILLDEPFSNLDASLRTTVREDVRRILRDADATAVFVTHDQEEALSLADRVAVMNAGRLHQVAHPQTLYAQPATEFVASFVGEADVVRGHTTGDRYVQTALGRLASQSTGAGDVLVMLRPEALRLHADPEGVGEVVGVDYFGHDQLVHVRLDDGTMVRARRGPTLDLPRGTRVAAAVDGPVVTFPVQPTRPVLAASA